jgi:hypothetical protein
MKLRMLSNKKGCFGGGSAPSVPAPPAPAPIPSPSEVSPQQTAEQRANKIKGLQYGLLSTVKTGPQGVTGNGADLSAPVATGTKKTIGS